MVLNEIYRIAFRKQLYASIADLQADLDEWIRSYKLAWFARPARRNRLSNLRPAL